MPPNNRVKLTWLRFDRFRILGRFASVVTSQYHKPFIRPAAYARPLYEPLTRSVGYEHVIFQ